MLSGRQIVLSAALYYRGNWNKMYEYFCSRTNKIFFNNPESLIKSNYITILDPDFPKYLKDLPCPPFILFYYGNIDLINKPEESVSIVGAREPTEYSIEAVKDCIRAVVDKYTVVSGLAMGIDRVAHEETLSLNGRTIAVLANGIDYCYPQDNLDLYQRIKNDENSLIISEYPNDTPPERSSFVYRNRLVTGLSYTLLVGEAHCPSGTMTSVLHATQQGRDLCCIVQPFNSEFENNRLIYDGAYEIYNGRSLFETLETWKNRRKHRQQFTIFDENFLK